MLSVSMNVNTKIEYTPYSWNARLEEKLHFMLKRRDGTVDINMFNDVIPHIDSLNSKTPLY